MAHDYFQMQSRGIRDAFFMLDKNCAKPQLAMVMVR